jgi:regulatory protein
LAELRAKLRRKGYPPAVADRVVAQLADEGLASDARFIEALLDARRTRGYGPLRIRHDLRQKGIDGEHIGRALEFAAGDWLALLRRVRQRKFGSGLPRNPLERARQARFLQARGFTLEQIRRVLGRERDD